MKILVLSHTAILKGGAERSMLEVLDLWSKDNEIEPIFILPSPPGNLSEYLDEKGWKHHSLEYSFWSEGVEPKTMIEKINHYTINKSAVERVREIIKEEEPDYVYTNSIVCPWAAFAAYLEGTPHVWFVREFGDLDHGRKFLMPRTKIFEDIDKTSNLIVTNSKAMVRHITQYISKDKVTFIYHPFNISAVIKRSNEKTESPFKNELSLKLILVAGSITETKGQMDAVEAVALLKDKNIAVELCLVGSEDNKPFSERLHAFIGQRGIKENVHFIGHVKNPLSIIKHADIGIMGSRMEAFGRTTFEFLCLSKPVLGVNAGATPEMVVGGFNGELYSFGSPEELAILIKKFFENRSLIETYGKNSQIQAQKLMSTEHNPHKLLQAIDTSIRHIRKAGIMSDLNYYQVMNRYSASSRTLKYILPVLPLFIYNLLKKIRHRIRKLLGI